MLIFWLLISIMSLIALAFVVIPLSMQQKVMRITPILLKISFGLVFILCALLLYRSLGHYPALKQFRQTQGDQLFVKNAIRQYGSIENILTQFNAYVKAHPEDKKARDLQRKLTENE